MPVRTIIILALGLSCKAAVIEVTAGGAVGEPTYQFSDSSGTSVATLHADVSDGTLHTSSTVHAPGLAVSNAPVTTLLTPASCTASTSSDPAHDALYSSTCENAYNGNNAQWWLVTASRADADFWYQLVLSNVSTVTRIVFLQLVNIHEYWVASRVVIEFYDASDTLLWKKNHDCLTVYARPWALGPEDLFLFPFVAGVSKIRFTFQGWYSHGTGVVQSTDHSRRGFKRLEIYGVATG